MKVNPDSKASIEFDITRPLNLTRTVGLDDRDYPTVFLYSTAVDGDTPICIAKIAISQYVGLTTEQEEAFIARVANEFIMPTFSQDDVDSIAFELMDIDDVHDTVCDHHTNRAKHALDEITTRHRYAAGVR